MSLDAVGGVGFVERAPAGRVTGRITRRRVNYDPASLERARLPLNHLVVGHRCHRLGSSAAGWDGVRRVVADDGGLVPDGGRLLLLLAVQAQAVFHGQQQTANGQAVARDLDEGRLVDLTVDDRVRLAVLAVQILGDVQRIPVAAIAEGAVLFVDPQRVHALGAMVGVALKGEHHVLLVGLQIAHGHDGLCDVFDDRGRHGVSAAQLGTPAGVSSTTKDVPNGRREWRPKGTRKRLERRHGD